MAMPHNDAAGYQFRQDTNSSEFAAPGLNNPKEDMCAWIVRENIPTSLMAASCNWYVYTHSLIGLNWREVRQ
jgi:hypothetical protein